MFRILTAFGNIAKLSLHFLIIRKAPWTRFSTSRITTKVVSSNYFRIICCPIENLKWPWTTFDSRVCPWSRSAVFLPIASVACVLCVKGNGKKKRNMVIEKRGKNWSCFCQKRKKKAAGLSLLLKRLMCSLNILFNSMEARYEEGS